MKRSALILLATIATAGFAGERAHADSKCGTFKSVIKDVKVTKAGAPSAAPAKEGAKVCQGETITAGADSRANVLMDDGNNLNLSPNTSLVIEAYSKKKVVLNVLGGKLRSAISDTNKYDGDKTVFQVKTKSAVAGVRGTDFLTSYTPSTGKTEIITITGKVEVGQIGSAGQMQNPVAVSAGQKTEAAIGQPPSPPSLVPAAELRQIDASTAAPPPQSPAPGSTGAAPASPNSEDSKKKPDGAPPANENRRDVKSGDGKTGSNGTAPDGAPGRNGGGGTASVSGPGSDSGPGSGPGRGPGGDGPGRAPAGMMPGGATPGGGSMVGAGESSGGAQMRPPAFDSQPAAPPVFTPPNAQLPVTYVPPSSVTDTLNNTGPTLLRVNVKVQ